MHRWYASRRNNSRIAISLIHSQGLPNKFPNHEELSSVIWCNFAERPRMSTLCVMSMMVNSTKILIMLMDDWSSRMWVSALCIFFFFLCSVFRDSWLGYGSSCFLEVVASSAGEKGGAYGSQDSHQVVSAQRKKKNQNKREQRHIAVCVVESANIRVVSSVQI